MYLVKPCRYYYGLGLGYVRSDVGLEAGVQLRTWLCVL